MRIDGYCQKCGQNNSSGCKYNFSIKKEPSIKELQISINLKLTGEHNHNLVMIERPSKRPETIKQKESYKFKQGYENEKYSLNNNSFYLLEKEGFKILPSKLDCFDASNYNDTRIPNNESNLDTNDFSVIKYDQN